MKLEVLHLPFGIYKATCGHSDHKCSYLNIGMTRIAWHLLFL